MGSGSGIAHAFAQKMLAAEKREVALENNKGNKGNAKATKGKKNSSSKARQKDQRRRKSAVQGTRQQDFQKADGAHGVHAAQVEFHEEVTLLHHCRAACFACSHSSGDPH